MDPLIWLYVAMAAGVGALVLAGIFTKEVYAASPGNDRMVELMEDIRSGAMAFLRREYTAVTGFVGVMAVLIFVLLDWGRPWGAIAYIFGAVLSALAGFIGMRVATAANARTAQAAMEGGINKALPLAFRGGAVMGFTVAGLGLLGLSLGYFFFEVVLDLEDAFSVITAIGLGASTIALFSRVGGGIFTKAADVGADLVGKVEAGIPEDDPRNPAVIADNVGDNVGDVAGMGADLFESYVGSLIAPIVFASFAFSAASEGFRLATFMYPLLIAAVGMGASIIGSFFVKPGKGNLATALHKGTWVAAGLTVVIVAILTPAMFSGLDGVENVWGLFASVVTGLVVGLAIGQISEVFTSDHYRVVKQIADQAETGPATVALAGIAEGMRSAAFSVIVVAAGMAGAYAGGQAAFSFENSGIYGIAIAAIGVLATLGITVAVDAYGPIADNAGGIAEMAGLPPEVRETTDALDSLGNTTAAVAKGFAIASAAVTALALFFTFREAVGRDNLPAIDILDIEVMVGLFLGGMFPFLFASMTIKAVGRAAFEMIEEVRRQFREIPGLREGKEGVRPDSARCVDISTKAALREMLLPGSLAVALPIVTGFISVEALGGLLAGALVTGFLLAIFMSNAGGAWDNAKKFIEAGAHGGKGSDAHKAAVVGDTIGDPFKDTAGPAMNIVIKVMTIVSLIFASAFVG
ncbi:Pyrophosphate-energized proton pump [hydrothermal vent metagenome]|uniref:Pyrophosphate-energized proton pump n=1 Tax=hydrothermal vent metagenome TaxID=652676 RepID=A0A3B0SW84_9ZZZZ